MLPNTVSNIQEARDRQKVSFSSSINSILLVWVPGALMKEDSDVEPVLRGKEFHNQLVMSARGAGSWKWQYMCLTFASLPRHSVTVQRMNT